MQFGYVDGIECSDLHEKVRDTFIARAISLVGTSTLNKRIESNSHLIQQGVTIISEDEVECSGLIGKGQIAYLGKYKEIEVAVKALKGDTFSSACREYQVLTLHCWIVIPQFHMLMALLKQMHLALSCQHAQRLTRN